MQSWFLAAVFSERGEADGGAASILTPAINETWRWGSRARSDTDRRFGRGVFKFMIYGPLLSKRNSPGVSHFGLVPSWLMRIV